MKDREIKTYPVEETVAVKEDKDKLRYDLVPVEAMEQIIDVLTYGAKKYKDRNWEKGLEYSRVYAALQRHLNSFWMGINLDFESQRSHLAHAGCCLLFLLQYESIPSEYNHLDDRPRHDIEKDTDRDGKEE